MNGNLKQKENNLTRLSSESKISTFTMTIVYNIFLRFQNKYLGSLFEIDSVRNVLLPQTLQLHPEQECGCSPLHLESPKVQQNRLEI
jgi:hypothetical protein